MEANDNNDRATQRALDALDTLAEQWAESFGLKECVANLLKSKTPAESVYAFIEQAYVEGLYNGRMSHHDYPVAAHPTEGQEQTP